MPLRSCGRLGPSGLQVPDGTGQTRACCTARSGKNSNKRFLHYHGFLPGDKLQTSGGKGSGRHGDDSGSHKDLDLIIRQAHMYIQKRDVAALSKMVGSETNWVFKSAIIALQEAAGEGQEMHSMVRAVLNRLDWEEHGLQMTALFREYTFSLVSLGDMAGIRMLLEMPGSSFGVAEGVRQAGYDGLNTAKAVDELEMRMNGQSEDDLFDLLPTVARHAVEKSEPERVERLLNNGRWTVRNYVMQEINHYASDGGDIWFFLPAVKSAIDQGLVDRRHVGWKFNGQMERYEKERAFLNPEHQPENPKPGTVNK